ncbi:MAG: hypothetical protein IJJ56_11230 [Prevotella sp.]|nr:hypothetical protein [Prevotella sp.]
MKNLFKYSIGVLFAGLTMTACSPESFDGADINGLPQVSGVDFQMTVDQETNQMVATYTPAAGTYPIWILNGTQYSTLQEVGYQTPEAGTYTIDLKLGNRNGFSQGTVSKTFTFNETKVDYSADFRRLCDKEWRFANKEVGHLGCGPAGTAGTEWWSAQPDDKKDFGMYDDRITFTADTRKGGTFNYNAGADGLTYVNTGTTKWGHEDADWDATIGNQTSTWSFEVYDWQDADGNVSKQTYIQLAANTAFPYISSDAQYEDPKFRIESLTASKLVLVYETPDRSIAWRFIFTSAEAEAVFEGFDANSDFNMWKGITPVMSFYYNPDPGWGNEQTAAFEALFQGGNNDYTVTIPEACYDRWQAQVHFHTDLNISAANHYDFSAIFSSDVDINGVTVKLTNEADADAIIDVDNVDLKAGEDYIFWKSDIPGMDLSQVKLVLDFGRAAGPTVVNVRNIVLKDHANDDGTKLPEDNPGGGDVEPVATMDWNYESGSNLWKAVDDGSMFDAFGYYFADDGWGGIAYSEATHSGDTYELTLPEGLGGSQWQGQFHIDTKLTASASKTYNFYLVMEADQDCPQVTFKLTDSGDSNFFIEERVDVPADGFVFKREGVTLKEGTDASAIRLFFDFGGSPAGTHIKISKIYFEEAVTLNYDDADNLWKGVDDGSMFDAFGYYFAAGDDWHAIDYTEVKQSGNVYELTLPAENGSNQWQAQFHIDTKLTASAAKSYNFQFDIESDSDLPQVTMKLTDAGDTNWFVEERNDVAADEVQTFSWKGVQTHEGADATAIRLFFDFGGSPGGANIKISNIVFKEIQ